MSEATCTRRVMVAELHALTREHAATPARLTAQRVRLARAVKDAERELDAFDRARARGIRRESA